METIVIKRDHFGKHNEKDFLYLVEEYKQCVLEVCGNNVTVEVKPYRKQK